MKLVPVAVVFLSAVLFSFSLIPSVRAFGESGMYQTVSYIGALSMGMTLYVISLRQDPVYRWVFTSMLRPALFILPLLQLACIFLTGGRGGLVAAIIECAIFSAWELEKASVTRSRLWIPFVYILAGCVIAVMAVSLMSDSLEIGGLSRIGRENNDRIVLYTDCCNRIESKPLLGHGFFEYMESALPGSARWPHNLFLEIAYACGIPVLICFIALLFRNFRELRSVCRVDDRYRLITVFTVTALTELMFSSTFLASSLFWFVLGFCCNATALVKQSLSET